MKITQKELDEKLELHRKWLNDEPGGDRLDLSNHDLRGANLRGAYLVEADLTFTKGILSFTLGAHFGWATLHDKYVSIGCEGHVLDHWLDNYESIGKKNSYTDDQIRLYGVQLKALKEMIGEE